MNLEGKTILLISPEPWSHIFVSKHHYAIHLSKRGNLVFFLNPPSKKYEIIKTEYNNVWEVNYKGFPKGLRFLPLLLQHYFIRRVFNQLQERCKVRFEIVWSFDNSVFYDFSALPDKILKISHIVDLNQNFETEKAAKTANVCFGVCLPIVNKLRIYNGNTFFINHGNHSYSSEGVAALPGENEIKAFYAGNLDIAYLDWGLFKKVISDNQMVDFILAGPWTNGKIKDEVQSFPNTYYIGCLKAEDLYSYYTAVDILLLIYKADRFKEQLSNSHKMMEYLNSGKMIVATHTQEYIELIGKELFLMTDQNKEFPRLFKSAVQDLEYWNCSEKRIARQLYAKENTYENQIDRIEKHLNSN